RIAIAPGFARPEEPTLAVNLRSLSRDLTATSRCKKKPRRSGAKWCVAERGSLFRNVKQIQSAAIGSRTDEASRKPNDKFARLHTTKAVASYSTVTEILCERAEPEFRCRRGHACAPWIGLSRGRPSIAIQNDSGLPQGRADRSVLAWLCGNRLHGVGRAHAS